MKPGTIILAAALFVGVAGEAQAQQPVTVVLAEQPLPSSAPFVIQRRPDQTPRDVILLRADATADHLSDAVRSLLTIRQADGDVPAAQAIMRMRSQDARTTRRAFPWVQRVLGDLQRAAHRDVRGVGRVRAVEIWLPR